MKKTTKRRILALMLSVCMCLGILPAEMFGGIGSVQAEESTSADGVTCTRTDWDENGSRTTVWDFTGSTVSSQIKDSTYLGLTIHGSKVSLKTGGGMLSLKDTGAVELPIDAAATKVDVIVGAAGLTTGRSFTVGNDTQADNVVCGTDISSNSTWSKTYTADSGYFTSTPGIKITAGDSVISSSGSESNEIKLLTITLVEYKSAADDGSGDAGTGSENDPATEPDSGDVTEPAGGNEYVFDVGNMDTFAKATYAEGTELVNGDFTYICHANSAIESKAVTFSDGYVSTNRLSLGGSMTTGRGAVKFTTATKAEVKIYWISGGDGREFKIIDTAGNQVAITSEGSVKNTQYISTLTLEEAGTYLVGSASSSNYLFRVVVTELGSVAEPVVNTVEAVADASDATGATVNVSFTGTAGDANAKYVVEASNDNGANWTKVGECAGNETSGSVTVDLSDAKLGYGTWQFRVTGSNEVVASNVITYAANTYVLSGTYDSGLADAAQLTGLTFKATSDSIYVVPAVTLDTTAHTYSVVLEKGTTYEVEAVGVDEYSVVNPAEAFTYSADTTLNLEFVKKVFYPVTISLGSTPDLTGKNIEYIFVHEDGTKYSFTDASAILLRDGNYTVSLGGDFEQMPYGIKKGDSLTVAGAAVNHAISFVALNSWSFTEVTETIQSTTGYFKGLYVDATTGKFAPNGNSAQFNTGAVIKVPVTGACSVAVTAYQGQYALYTINGTQADTTNATTTIEYTGEAGTVDIVSTGTSYIASVSVIYPAEEVKYVAQSVMPSVPEDDADANTAADTDGVPRQNKQDSITVQPVGQKLNLSQSGGSFADKFADTKDVAYYLFPATADNNKLEFDLVVTESKATGNSAGFFGGVFTDDYVYSIGLRAGGTKIRGIYSKNGGINGGSFAGAGSPAEEVVGLNRQIHYEIGFVSGKPSVTITFLDDAGVEQSRTWSQSALANPDGSTATEFYYGFALANVSATVTNMVYTAEDGTVLYDQNACYYAKGTAPKATAVSAVVAESREYIDVSWTGTVPEDDGTYVVEMQKDGGAWTELSADVTGLGYRYEVPAGDGGNYLFRVCGQLGKETLGGTRNAYVTMTDTVYVMGALAKPVVEIKATATDISISWDAVSGAEYYQVYRYSFDEGEANAVCVAERLTATSYKDTNVTQEMPYYYQVKAISDSTNNSSPLSETVWQVATAGHTGDYVYEDEATEIFITKKSYDTVFTDKVTLEGNVYGAGTLEAVVNGAVVSSKEMSAKDAFSFELTVAPGRNDVNLLFTDGEGNVTRKTFNFVYLTNYDMVVDAAYTGTDGAANANGIPTYKTVQAAVDAVPADNADSKVILVMAGSYEERLVVSNPYVSLIGEDRENTLIHYYPGVLGTKYEAGGDMDKRCATVIASTATGFSAENISFANDYVYATADGKSNKSADAIRVEADQSGFVNVKFTGVQDTLYMHSGKQYYNKCVIEGLVDFIYAGDKARSFFNDCEIVFVYESTKSSGYVCAPKTAADATYGLTFYNCVITSEEGCSGTGYLLARPWGADAYITWIDCYMGNVINELAPYNSMSGNMPEDARFFEFGTYGPGFAINADRRQISPSKASEMVGANYLGWAPDAVVAAISGDHYVGNIVTDRDPQYEGAQREDTTYLWSDGDDTGLKMYNMEGYSTAYGVSGGGLLKETNENYYKVANANEFLDALIASKKSGKNSVIELTADINLGCNEIENFTSYKDVIKAYSAQPLTHPTLIESGVSQLTFNNVYNLTIFSQNGASIKHANITMKNSENIIIRNIKFDELWEWDEATGGDYDRNDWDYMTIDSNSNGIWIDHCTFYKAYDGIVDVKNPSPITNVTISWCEFLPGSEGNVFFDVMMNDVFANPDKYATYQHMLDEGMNKDQVYMYAYGQKKTHLLGQSADATNAAGIRVTLANNYYKDSMDRMPRLRYGNSHVYNCIMDAQDLLDVKLSIKNDDIAKKIVSNGAASTCGAQVLLENCYISGIQNALNSGNGSDLSGYINAINSVYYMNGVATELAPKCNTSGDTRVLVTDADAFISQLPYADYVLYDAEDLNGIVKAYSGAGKLDLTVLQWEKTSYNAEWSDPVIVEDEEDIKPVINPDKKDDDDDDDEIIADEVVSVVEKIKDTVGARPVAGPQDRHDSNNDRHDNKPVQEEFKKDEPKKDPASSDADNKKNEVAADKPAGDDKKNDKQNTTIIGDGEVPLAGMAAEEDASGMNWWWIVLILVAVVVAGGVGYTVYQKKQDM